MPETVISVVVPTYNESSTVGELLGQLSRSLPKNLPAEIVVIDDDSPDGTAQAVRDYAEKYGEGQGPAVKLFIRKGVRGLSSAIVEGISKSSGRFLVVMDADLSHPPSVVPKLLAPLLEHRCDVVVASRNIEGGGVVGWPFTRKLASWVATEIAKGLGLGVDDPMSGFFAFDRRAIRGVEFYAIGYKVLPEILAKSGRLRISEVPYTFVNRRRGASKLSFGVVLDYLRMSWKLYRSKARS